MVYLMLSLNLKAVTINSYFKYQDSESTLVGIIQYSPMIELE